MSRQSVDPNARMALNQLKYEIADELGLPHRTATENAGLSVGSDIYLAGPVGGQMTRRMIQMAENQLANRQE